ncbi:MAG: family 20 glycosylhydrolase [Planctomycetota bacterium]|nr:family 20 glycosylhydrolase [Planctomycetota bacterium]
MTSRFTRGMRAVAVVAAVLAGMAGGAGAQEILVKDGQTVAFLGDSITEFGAATPEGYVRLVARGLEANGVRIQVVGGGVQRHTSNDMLARLERDVLSKKPHWMTLSCGVNDTWLGVSLDTYKKNITAIVDRCQGAGVKVVILTATMVGKDPANENNQKVLLQNEFLRGLAKERKYPLADLHTDMLALLKKAPADPAEGAGNSLTTDGVHMNAAGNRMMAMGVLRAFGLNEEQLWKAQAAWSGQSPRPAAPNAAALEDKSDLPLIPYPKSIKLEGGTLAITDKSRIVVASDALTPLAKVLAEEIYQVTGVRLGTGLGKPGPGDVGLEIAAGLKGEAHRVSVADRVIVQGGNYVGVGMGTVTVLQAIGVEGGRLSLPRMTVEDAPFCEYTGQMVDVARQFNSIESLKQCVVLARLYKMKYFQLHLTDDQIFAFPSTKYPKLKGAYTVAELKDLVRFADERGVTMVPEFEVPGHSKILREAFPDVFSGCGEVINFVQDGALPVLDDLVGEMCDVFRSSPYFHIGADECYLGYFETLANVVEHRKRTGMNTPQQFAWFINEMNKIVKKHGKKTICWEGFNDTHVDKDVIVIAWDGRYFNPPGLVKAGYRIINVPWDPSVHFPARYNYDWNLWLVGSQLRRADQLPRSESPEKDPVIGGQMVLWEMGGDLSLPMLRGKAPARHERVHSPDAGKTYADYDRRFASTDRILDLLVHGFAVGGQGLTDHGDYTFDRPFSLTITPSPTLKEATIRYTLDGSDPTPKSKAYAGPIVLAAPVTGFRAQAFGADDKPLGFPRRTDYRFNPIRGTAQKLLPTDPAAPWVGFFDDPVMVTLKSAVPGTIRFTVDGKPATAESPAYTQPIKIEKQSCVSVFFAHPCVYVNAALFVDGKGVGNPVGLTYIWVARDKFPCEIRR